MRESRTYGFVRGARGNSRPYRVASVMTAPGTQKTVSLAAGGSAYRDAAEAHLRGAGPPPLTKAGLAASRNQCGCPPPCPAGANHFGPEGSRAFRGFGQTIQFRLRTFHVDDLAIYGVGCVLILD
jgi:hypothetical protein